MIDVEPLIVSCLERLVPMPSGEGADWQNVLRRTGTERRVELSRRKLAVGFAALVAAILVAITTPVGAAIAKGLGDFSGWLTGHPGKPASSADQRAFEAVNRRWSGFPTTTKLRELIRVEVGGKEYVLFGFRSGSTLCLQLNARAFHQGEVQQCVPVSTFAHVSAPIVVVKPDLGFQGTRAQPAAQVSFGIVADGVSRIDVEATDGMHRAFVGANAYLFVDNEPNTANHVLRVSAVSGGKRTTVSLPQIFGPLAVQTSQPLRATGPTRLEARLEHPRVGWLSRHGGAPHRLTLTPEQRSRIPTQAIDASFVKPDPLGNMIVGFNGNCLYFAAGQERVSVTACGAAFKRGPLWMLTSDNTVAGVAADGVARVMLFLADSQREPVPLRDNLFAALFATAQLPGKIVGYDAQGRVVAIESLLTGTGRFAVRPLPTAVRQLRPVLRLTAPHGTVAVVRLGPRIRNYQCWRADFSTGQAPGACELLPITGPKIWVDVVQPAGRDLFVAGKVNAKVTSRVELHFANGDVITTRPAAGHYLFAIPKSHLSSERRFGYVLAIDHHGHRVQRQGIVFRMSG